MSIIIKDLAESDYPKAIAFAVKGMHFDWYLDNQIFLDIYGKYFFYSEINKATQVIAAYYQEKLDGYYREELAGILLAEINGETPVSHSAGKTVFTGLIDLAQLVLVRGDAYNQANQKMLLAYQKNYKPDGQILFLAANPDMKGKGIGTALLRELERRENGKTLYLYTDSGCTYQFYEHRDFDRVCEEQITVEIGTNSVPLTCMLYSKQIKKTAD